MWPDFEYFHYDLLFNSLCSLVPLLNRNHKFRSKLIRINPLCLFAHIMKKRVTFLHCGHVLFISHPHEEISHCLKLYFEPIALSSLKWLELHSSLLREMRCLRNKIHANLFLTFVLDCTFWMATDIMQGRELATTGLKVCHLQKKVVASGRKKK